MAKEDPRGVWTALVTPFRPDGAVDWDGFLQNIAFQVEQGVSGIVPTGTTGESPTVTWDEHNDIVSRTVKASGGRALVMAGVGSNSAREAQAGARHAAECGADAVLLVDCYYNGPSSIELRKEYYEPIASEVPGLLVVPYVIPGRTGCALAPEDLAILAEKFDNVRAVKEATGDLDRMRRTRDLVGGRFHILSGDDNLTHRMVQDPGIRASGAVSVMSNVFPGPVARMVRSALEGRAEEARGINDALAPIFEMVGLTVESVRTLPGGRREKVRDKFRNPVPVKTIMQGLGMPSGPCRRPLGRMTAEAVGRARTTLRSVFTSHPALFEPISKTYGIDIEARLADDARWAATAYDPE